MAEKNIAEKAPETFRPEGSDVRQDKEQIGRAHV